MLDIAATLRDTTRDLCEPLRQAAEEFGEQGKPFPSAVVSTLGSFNDTFLDLLECTSNLAGREIVCDSIDELVETVRLLANEETSPAVKKVQDLTNRAERLRKVVAEDELGPVASVIAQLRAAIRAQDTKSVQSETEALEKLLDVVGGTIDPSEWRALGVTIMGVFGPEIFGLAAAGQLRIVDEPSQHDESAEDEKLIQDEERVVAEPVRNQEPVSEEPVEDAQVAIPIDVEDTQQKLAAQGDDAKAQTPVVLEPGESTVADMAATETALDDQETNREPVTHDPPVFSRATEPADVRTSPEPASAPVKPEGTAEDPPEIDAAPVAFAEQGINSTAWELLRTGQYNIAYQVLAAAEQDHSESHIPAWIAAALALTPKLRYAEGRIAQRLRDLYQRFDVDVFVPDEEEWNYGLRCLFAAASFRSALLSPFSGAAALLQDLSWKSLDSVRRVGDAIANFGSLGLPLDATLLNATRSEAEWNSQLDALSGRAKSWLDATSHRHLIYNRATRVWRKWTHECGWVHELISLVAARDERSVQRLDGLVQEFMDDDRIKRAVQDDDRKQRSTDDDIEARALQQLLSHAGEALDIARERLRLEQTRPTRATEFAYNHTRKLRSEVEELAPLADRELADLANSHPASKPVTAGVHVLRRALADLKELLTTGVLPATEPDPPDIILTADLLRFPGIDVGEDWTWKPFGGGDRAAGLLSELEMNPTWSEAFHRRCETGDLAGAERILTLTGTVIQSGLDVEQAEQARVDALRRHRNELQRDVAQTRASIETATWRGTLSDSERARLIARVEGIERQNVADQVQQFEPLRRELATIRTELANGEREAIERVRSRLDELNLPDSDAAKSRILRLLDEHDLLAANEYIGDLAEGKQLPEPVEPTLRVAEFFPDRAREIERWLDTGDLARAIDAHSRGQNLPGLPFGDVPGAQRKSFESALRSFAEMKRARRATLGGLQVLFGGIGFADVHISSSDTKGAPWYVMRTRAIADREVCPAPAFGSFARGSYRLLCVFDRRSMEDIVHEVDSSKGDAAIVLHFGFVTESRRRELARLSRQSKHRVFLLLDDILLLHLAARRGARLSAFFHATLPFTAIDPYVTAAGNVPREMFFGRDHERAEILAPRGSSFIFGGRQLGKTALLRDAERWFHAPEEGRIAKWIDTKAEGLGYNRAIADIWQVLAHHLALDLELPHGISQFTTFAKRVEEWLSIAPDTRRIVLLLDEADEFLSKDAADDFSVTRQLKNLMERSDGRFKVVFAGLHNVQRTTRLANHPLAHFGSALCIGPLLGVHDIRDGRALVEDPLRAAGYEFENPDLPTQILSQTNYYPSLIQLYCKQLLKHISDFKTAQFDHRSGPPFAVTGRHVEEAYRSRDLRREIRERFHLTLQLDPRYEVLALAIAHGSLEEEADEFSVPWIRGEVGYWWPAGFTDSSIETLRAFLDEMVGLGVLRHGRQGGYALRSPNVLALLGSQREIEESLLREREKAAEYEPSSYHVLLDAESQTFSPFTALQSSELVSESGVTFVAGTEAAGLAFARPALEKLGDERGFRVVAIEEPQSFVSFRTNLEALARDRANSFVCLVSPPQWDAQWVRDTVTYVKTLRSRERTLSVVFLGGPAEAWRWIEAGGESGSQPNVKTISLRPWQDGFVRRWMADQGFPSDAESRARLLDATGGWPTLIAEVKRRSADDPIRWRQELQTLSRMTLPAHAFIGDPVADRLAVLTGLRELGEGEVTTEDLAQVLGVDTGFVRRTISWASLIAIVTSGADGKLRLNPTVAAALSESR